uniref:Uncharacterized protein n=1 Tax=Anguilla anguilla TaxID=7936 RepID=A0A0E9UQ35_ANGAN
MCHNNCNNMERLFCDCLIMFSSNVMCCFRI